MSSPTEAAYPCIVCGEPTADHPGCCSTPCKAQADLEIRRNRARIVELRRGASSPDGSDEQQALVDRNAELEAALVNSAPPLGRRA